MSRQVKSNIVPFLLYICIYIYIYLCVHAAGPVLNQQINVKGREKDTEENYHKQPLALKNGNSANGPLFYRGRLIPNVALVKLVCWEIIVLLRASVFAGVI